MKVFSSTVLCAAAPSPEFVFRLMECAAGFRAEIQLEKGARRASIRSLPELVALELASGTGVRMTLHGPDACKAAAAVSACFQSGFVPAGLEIRLVATDLDGTLLREDHRSISPRTRKALQRAAAQGVRIALISGRAPSMMWDAAAELGCVRYLIACNGAVILDMQTGRRLLHRPLSAAQSQAVLQLLKNLPFPLEAYCNDRVYIRQGIGAGAGAPAWHSDFSLCEGDESAGIENPAVGLDADPGGVCVDKFNIDGISDADRLQIQERVAAVPGLHCTYSTSWGNLEINFDTADKGAALRWLCARLGLAPEQVMAFGDGGNDFGMLRWAGWSFAMANAEEEALLAAKFRTLKNTEDGIACVLEQCAAAAGWGD